MSYAAISIINLIRSGILKYFATLNIFPRRTMQLLKTKAYINGAWVDSHTKKEFPVINPADGSVIAKVPDMDAVDAKNAVDVAEKSFKCWKKLTAKERYQILIRWFDLSEAKIDKIAEIITAESGKTLDEAKAEVTYGNSFIEWFSGLGRHINGDIVQSPWPDKKILMTRHPIGVVSVMTPWNFPYCMITRKISAAMAAGCTCVVKPSEDTPLSALVVAELSALAGVPKGVINVVTTSLKNCPAVGKILCEDDNVKAISFTGSTVVGKLLYRQAATGMRKAAFELGGNAPFIVFPTAELENAMDQAMNAKFRNNGQACVGANRFYIHEDVFDAFVKGFRDRISKLVLGPGTKKGVDCGPLIHERHLNKVASLVDDALSKGADALIGGKREESLGKLFYQPTLLVNVTPKMKINHEEIFGPVAVCHKFCDEKQVLHVANDTLTGLAAYIFTRDYGQAIRVSQKLDVGMVAINDGLMSAAEPAFGGIKESGIGREGGLHGALEYTELKYTLMSQIYE